MKTYNPICALMFTFIYQLTVLTNETIAAEDTRLFVYEVAHHWYR